MNFLDTLLELQEIDEAIKGLEDQAHAIPIEIGDLQSRLRTTGEACARKTDELKELKVREREKEGEMQALDSQFNRFQQQLLGAKNNVVYSALLKEIEGVKEKISHTADEGLEIINEIELLEREIEDQKKVYESQEMEFKAREAMLMEKKVEVESGVDRLAKKRESIAKRVPENLMRRYQRIRESKKGPAVVPMKDNICSACFGTIPLQRVNEIMHDEELKSCDNCGRIIYYRETDDESR